MDMLMDFLTDNSDKIWTLFSVIIGGTVTYVSTSSAEKKKNKRQAQKEKLEQVLLPYCTCLELTIHEIDKVYGGNKYLYSGKVLEQWLSNLKKPLEYLAAYKRVYLSKSSREILVQYEKMLSRFEIELHREYQFCLIKYNEYLEQELIKFPNVSSSMLITFSTNKVTETKIKSAIINRSEISLLDNITAVDFIHNDDEDNYRSTSIQLRDDYKEDWSAINYGVMSIDDIEDGEEELACILLDFIDANIRDEKETLINIINDTSSATLLLGISETIKDMRNKLVKEIDKIANY